MTYPAHVPLHLSFFVFEELESRRSFSCPLCHGSSPALPYPMFSFGAQLPDKVGRKVGDAVASWSRGNKPFFRSASLSHDSTPLVYVHTRQAVAAVRLGGVDLVGSALGATHRTRQARESRGSTRCARASPRQLTSAPRHTAVLQVDNVL